MSRILKRESALVVPSDVPHLVPQLAPETLHQLIRHHGLDACDEIVASATPAQLTALLDLDLWRPERPGSDAAFDVDRFGEWLEMLADAAPSMAARTIAALDTNVVVAGLCRYVRVFDPGIFEPVAQSDDEAIDRHEAMHEGDVIDAIDAGDAPTHESSGDGIECEVGGYIVRARRADVWDAIVALLVALDAEQGECFHAIMDGCRDLSNSNPEIGGLDDLPQAPAQHLHDVTIEREHRRSQQGYATPADARAFLQMARQPAQAPSTGSITVNPIVAAYFREADEAPESSVPPAPAHPRALPPASGTDPQAARLTRLRPLMEYVHDRDDIAYFGRTRELAFLANALVAGCSVQSRPFTPQEASDAAASICNLGLECQPVPDSFLIDHDLVAVFEVGWSALYQNVNMFVARRLISMLDDLRCVDDDIQLGLVALGRALRKHCDAGTPWLAREAADVIGMLDMTAWISVCGLLDECPVLPAALTANLGGRTTTVSPTAFDFISTSAQIGDIHTFMQKLPDILSG